MLCACNTLLIEISAAVAIPFAVLVAARLSRCTVIASQVTNRPADKTGLYDKYEPVPNSEALT